MCWQHVVHQHDGLSSCCTQQWMLACPCVAAWLMSKACMYVWLIDTLLAQGLHTCNEISVAQWRCAAGDGPFLCAFP